VVAFIATATSARTARPWTPTRASFAASSANTGERLLESTEFGDVLARSDASRPARVYVKGLFVAEEPNFLFSYNITKLSAALRRALTVNAATSGAPRTPTGSRPSSRRAGLRRSRPRSRRT
jgi:hypothetical protein